MEILNKLQRAGNRYGFIAIVLAGLILTLGGIGLSHFAKAASATKASSIAPAPMPSSTHYENPNQEVTLRLNADGFVPAELTRGPGSFQLSVDNRSGVEELTLLLKRSDGTPVRELRIPRNAGDWSEVVDLAVGIYTLTEVAHGNWVCLINIQ